VITANTTEVIISKGLRVGINAFTAGFSFLSGVFYEEANTDRSHDGLPKTVHLFTKRGLAHLSYSLGSLGEFKSASIRKRPRSFPGRSRDQGYRISLEETADFLMAGVAKVTSAAPTYFPSVHDRNEYFIDGGVLQNNPAIPSILYTLEEGHRSEDLSCYLWALESNLSGLLESAWPLTLTFLWFETTQPHLEEDLAILDILHPGAFHRFQYHFENQAPALDDIKPETLTRLGEIGDELVEENQDDLREIFKALKLDL